MIRTLVRKRKRRLCPVLLKYLQKNRAALLQPFPELREIYSW